VITLLGEEGRRPLEDLPIVEEPAIVAAKAPPVPPALGRQATVEARTGVAFGLLDPAAHRGLGQVEVPRDLAGGPVPRWHSSTISAVNFG
jgi:hypothetical protein